jgi:septum formation protein
MSLWNPEHRLVLASGSATRRTLLAGAGLPFETARPEVDERAVEAATSERAPEAIARALAAAKAREVSARKPDAWVIGADQILSLDGRLIHKSRDRAAALATLRALSGRTHRLTSAFALARGGEIVAQASEAADLTMRALDEAAIGRYLELAGEEVLDSVGVYRWEGFGAHLFERVEGDHSTILGLPMLKLLAALRGVGALTL